MCINILEIEYPLWIPTSGPRTLPWQPQKIIGLSSNMLEPAQISICLRASRAILFQEEAVPVLWGRTSILTHLSASYAPS